MEFNANNSKWLRSLIVSLVLCYSIVLSTACRGNTILQPGLVTCEEKQTILDEHNRLRQSVALGHIRGQPGATKMMEMSWDDQLAADAQKWADNCRSYHDKSRSIQNRFYVGQNMARSFSSVSAQGPYRSPPEWKAHINGWFNEVRNYVGGYSSSTGHYTQVVWGDTYLVGCGYSYYYDSLTGFYTKDYVCNYGPGGNILGQEPYQPGQPSCNNYGMPYSNKYSGLCSKSSYYYHLGAYCTYG